MMPGVGFDQRLARGQIGARIKDLFFDSDLVLQTLGEQERTELSRFGYLVMRDARQSIRAPRQKSLASMTSQERHAWYLRSHFAAQRGRKARRPAAASKPGEPPRNQSGLLKNFIFFTYERARRSVVIGPARLAGTRTDPPPPRILEEGGPIRNQFGQPARIRPRPYMRPAFDRQIERGVWRRNL